MRERVAKPKKASTSSFSIPKLRQPTRGFGLNSSGVLRQTTAELPYLNKPLGHDISRISLHQQTITKANQPEDVEEQETETVAPQVMQEINEPENHQTVQREELQEEEEQTQADFPSQKLEEEELQMKPLDSSPQAVTQEQPVNEPVTHDISRMSLRVQTKLTINQPGDIYEQQADTVARQVMQQISQPQNQQFIQHEAFPETELQRKFLVGSATPVVQRQGGGVVSTSNLETSIQRGRQNGQPLSDDIRQPMEQAFGADFSGVKIHTDSRSHELNQTIQARAFTTGQDIFFRQGEYNPGSYQGKELLAHELTHVVQQNGNAIGRQKDSSATTPVTPDIDIQRVCCSQCEEEEELLQAKELPGHTIQLAPDVNTQVSQQTPQDAAEVENDVRQELDNNRARQASLGVQSPVAAGTTEPPPDENPKTQPESGKNASDSNSVEMAAPKDESPATVETQAEKPKEDVEAGVAEAVSPETSADKGDDAKDEGKEVKAGMAEAVSQKKKDVEDEEKASQAAETGGVNPQSMEAASPETKAAQGEQIAQQANAVRGAGLEKLPPQVNNQNPESMAQAVTPETVAEKKQATTEVLAAQAQQNAVNAQTSQLAATEVNFAPPEQETAQGEDDAILQEQQKAEAINITNSFLAEAALRVQTITQLGQGIEARIQGSTENAKASVMAAVEQQKATVTAQIAQQREQVQSQAQATIAQIQTQYQAAAATTSQTTAAERQKVAAEYTTSVQKVDETESNQLAKIEEFYTQAKEKYRAAGVKVGDEAIAFGEQKAAEWEAQITGKDDSFWDGPLTDNRLKARAKAAREVAKQYKDGLVAEGNKQADAVEQGKPKDIEGIHNVANQSRQQLQTLQQQTLDNLNSVEQQVLTQLADAQTQLTQTANQTLQSTLQTLDQQQAAQLQLLSVYGNGQVSAIERDAQKAIASIQDGINQAAASLQTAIQDTQAQLEGTPAPNPQELSATLAEILAQFDTSVAKVQEQTEQGITASQEGIAQGEQQAVTAVNGIAQSGLEESAAVSQEAKTSLTNLNQGATDTFNQIQQAFTTTVTNTTQAALTGFGQVTQGIQSAFDQSNQNMDTNFQKSVNDLEEGLRGSIQGDKQPNLDSDIQKYAQEAADKEQPRWKTVLKVLLVIAVIVVAIIVAPAVIGAVGALAGALGAGAALAGGIGAVVGGAIVGAVAGAVIQMGNNAIDGKNLLDGVGKAALAGAIGGALGGAGGVFGNMLAQAGRLGTGLTQSFLKFGIDVAFDIAGGIFGNLATGEPITLEAVLIGAAIGAAVQISTANLSRLGRFGRSVQGMQTRTFQAGEQFGTSLGNGIRNGFGGRIDTPTINDAPNVPRPDAEVTDPQSSVRSPEAETSTGRGVQVDEAEVPGGVPKDTTTESPGTKSPGEQEQNPATTDKNQEVVRIIRQDDDFASQFNYKGKTKSRVVEDGSVVPANPNGKATPLEHVYGSDPAKGDSPYTSFLTESGGVAKTYGASEIELDLPKLRADIESGNLKNVEILTPEQISKMITDEISQIATTVKKDIDVDAAVANGPQGIPDYVASLGISKGQSSKLSRRLLAYYNTTRDGEYLIKGTIPAEYLKGPYSTKAGEQSGTSGGSTKTDSNQGVDTPTASRHNADMSNVKQSDTEVKLPETNTSHERSTHPNEPEIEPQVVAKQQTPDGHNIKVLKDGRIIRCSTCEQIGTKYKDLLDQKSNLKQRLEEIEKIPDPQQKNREAFELIQELDQQNAMQSINQNSTGSLKPNSGFDVPQHSIEAQYYRYDSQRVTAKRKKFEFQVEITTDASGNRIINKLEYDKNRDPFSAQTKKDVHALTQGTDYQQYSASPKKNATGNDFRHIKSNEHTKVELSRMYEGQPVDEVLNHLKARKFLPESATENDLGEGVWRQYREEADNPYNLPPGPGVDNQRIGRISDRLRKLLDMGKENFEKTDMTIKDPELLRYLNINEEEGYRVESYDELMGVFTQLIHDPPLHGAKGEYYQSLQEARQELDFSFNKTTNTSDSDAISNDGNQSNSQDMDVDQQQSNKSNKRKNEDDDTNDRKKPKLR
ncbi:AAA ATPase (plasmid) [Nostoc linckia NIES-25]|nr:AAA ATPase [Nostoc linckia NIES-25]